MNNNITSGAQPLQGPEKLGEQQTIYNFILNYFKHSRRSSLICKHLAQTEIIIYGDVASKGARILGLRDFLQRKRVPDKKGPSADPQPPPVPPAPSLLPREENCFKDETSQGYHHSSSYVSEQSCVSCPPSRSQADFFSSLQLSSSGSQQKPQA